MTRVEHIGPHTRTAWIYALKDPDTGAVRYVGKTQRYMVDRHKRHIHEAKRGSRLPVHSWLRGLIEAEKPLVIASLELVTDQDWAERERFWIEHYRRIGPLFNTTSGGEGLLGHKFSDDHKSKIAAALKKGAHFNCETCGEQFWRKPNQIRRGHNKFCTTRCANARHKGRSLFDGT